MQYTVYLDESGTGPNDPGLVIGGYLATPDAWGGFSDEWVSILRDFDIDAFHMTDFANRAPPYTDWSVSQRTSCLARLTATIASHAWGGLVSIVPRQAYMTTASKQAGHVLGGIYGLASLRCFFLVADHLRRVDPACLIDYVMDHGMKGRGALLKLAALNRGGDELRLTSVRFDSCRAALPIQAADILAYEVYREHRRKETGVGVFRASEVEPLFRLPILGGIMTTEEIESFARIGHITAMVNPDLTPKRSRELFRLFGR